MPTQKLAGFNNHVLTNHKNSILSCCSAPHSWFTHGDLGFQASSGVIFFLIYFFNFHNLLGLSQCFNLQRLWNVTGRACPAGTCESCPLPHFPHPPSLVNYSTLTRGRRWITCRQQCWEVDCRTPDLLPPSQQHSLDRPAAVNRTSVSAWTVDLM